MQVIHTTKIVPQHQPPRPHRRAAKVPDRLDSSEELAKIERIRSEQTREYWKRFEQADSRIKTAVDGGWKIFGRVLARQSLVDLSRQMDEIRRSFVSYSSSNGEDKSARVALVKARRPHSQQHCRRPNAAWRARRARNGWPICAATSRPSFRCAHRSCASTNSAARA